MAYGGATYGGRTYAGYQPYGIPTPTTPAGPNVPAIGYLYKNVGISQSNVVDINAIGYLYKNVGVGPRWSPDLMRVVARFTDQYGVGYLYKNVT